MRYVIIDLDGASRGHFDVFSDLLEVIDDVRRDDPEMVDELHVLQYDDDGERVGAPIPALTLLPQNAADVADVTVSTGVAHASGDLLQPA
jgi:hypothetical protein